MGRGLARGDLAGILGGAMVEAATLSRAATKVVEHRPVRHALVRRPADGRRNWQFSAVLVKDLKYLRTFY